MFRKNTVYAADKATGRDEDGHIWIYDYDTDTLEYEYQEIGAYRYRRLELKDNRPVWDKFE